MTRLMVLAAVVATVGCSSYRPSAPLPPPEATVRVSFLSPRDLIARTATGDSVVLPAVRELHGSVIRAQLDTRMDSVRLRFRSAKAVGALPSIPEGSTVTVAREVFTRVEQRSFDAWKTLKLVGYIGAGLLALSLLAVGLALEDMGS